MHCDDGCKRSLLLLNGEETAGGESEGREDGSRDGALSFEKSWLGEQSGEKESQEDLAVIWGG